MPTLRGVKPSTVEKRLKALFFGMAGVGKTTAAIQFPQPYLIDTERGAENSQYVALLEKAGGAYFPCHDYDDLITEVTALHTTDHPYRTLVIDPLTVIYNDLLEKSIASIAKAEGKDKDDKEVTAFGRHKGAADRKIKHLINLLTRIDMNVIITSHGKTKFVKKGNDFAEEGNTFDCYGKLDFMFDLVFEIQKRGKSRVGMVKKTRLEGFADGETFDWSYDEVARRYGRDELERKANAETLASDEQVADLKRLTKELNTSSEIIDKWFDKAKAASFRELPMHVAEKCLAYLNKINDLNTKGAA